MDKLKDCLDSYDYIQSISGDNMQTPGKKITLKITSPSPSLIKDISILKSDVAYITIPDLELEEASGTGRYCTLEDILVDMETKLESSSSLFPALQRTIKILGDYKNGEAPFSVLIDDPIGLSEVTCTSDNKSSFVIKEETYQRNWEQNRELGISVDYVDKSLKNIENEDEKVLALVELIKSSKKIIALTGAGISVESGVPSFRGSGDSLWSNYNISDAEYGNWINSNEARKGYWRMKTEFYKLSREAKPNPSHDIFSFLEKKNKLLGVITQNIDSLHEISGTSPSKILHLHGTESEVMCLSCLAIFDREDIHTKILESNYDDENLFEVPCCHYCGGMLKPLTIMFGEPLNPDVVQKSMDWLNKKGCDLLIVMGTSLVVSPANKIPGICLSNNIPVVIINKEGDTQYDNDCNLLIKQPSGKIMSDVLRIIKNE